MAIRNMKQKSARVHDFSMIPRADIPRSSFTQEHMHKTAFSASGLIPIYLQEVLPGDTFNVGCTIVCRTATPIVPVMDNWHLETFFFFVPNRLVWTHWQAFMGEQSNPGDSIAFTIPQISLDSGTNTVGSIFDYFGIPSGTQITAGQVSVSCLPFRAYNLIWNTWFRDENLQNSLTVNLGDGPDVFGTYAIQKRGKRHGYFEAALPFVQKGTAVALPLGTSAPLKSTGVSIAFDNPTFTRTGTGLTLSSGTNVPTWSNGTAATTGLANFGASGAAVPSLTVDLTTATSATINQLRQSFQVQKLLERDARGGTRYTEIVRAHFGVISPDARLQRPEYLGGGHIPVMLTAIPQTSATGLTGATTPIGTLSATGQAQGRNGFTYAATEHGMIIGLVSARADLTYQQGIQRMWSRLTRYDFYFPAFAMLGEQPVYNREIYADGSANDALVFGYQERWAEYRYFPSRISGIFRSTAATPLDYWHSAQKFTALPTLNATFIQDNADTTLQRNFAGGAQTAGQQFLCDIFFTGTAARPLPMYSVPGLVDHF